MREVVVFDDHSCFFLFFLRNVDQCSRVFLDGNQATVCNCHDSRCITAVHV